MSNFDVHLQIVSLDDPDTPETVASLLADPGMKVRVTVALDTEDDTLERLTREAGATVLRGSADNSKGLGVARAKTAADWQGEPWLCGTDAHMRAAPGWAALLREDAGKVGKGVLSTYAAHIGKPASATIMRIYAWKSPAFPSFHGTRVPDAEHPYPARSWANMMWFAPAQWQQEVPVDASQLWGSEEQSTAVRSWTRGWDLWHPSQHVMWHRSSMDGSTDGKRTRRMWWTDRSNWYPPYKASQDRATELLLGNVLPGKYSIGTKRTIAEWEKWSGMEQATQTFVPEDEWRARF